MAGLRSFAAKHKQGTVFVFFVVFSLLLVIITNENLVVKPKEIGQSVLSVFQLAISGLVRWVSGTFNSIGELKQVRQELSQIRQELLEYERISRDIIELRLENRQLRELLDFRQETDYRSIPAEVIARQPGNVFSIITVNRGQSNGVTRFMPVVARQGAMMGLVGKVITVGFSTCTILPLFSQSSFVAARLESSRHDGLISGKGETSNLIVMRNIGKMAIREIQYGDLVLTSGLGRIFPKGIPIGRIRAVYSESYETSLELDIEPVVDFSKLEYVLILDAGE